MNKGVCLFWTIGFLGFAALQHNDPDFYLWMPIYLGCSLACFLCYLGKYLLIYTVALTCVVGALSAYYIFDLSYAAVSTASDGTALWDFMMENKKEEMTECSGLVICLSVLLVQIRSRIRRMDKG